MFWRSTPREETRFTLSSEATVSGRALVTQVFVPGKRR
jgi:hypothetical protein